MKSLRKLAQSENAIKSIWDCICVWYARKYPHSLRDKRGRELPATRQNILAANPYIANSIDDGYLVEYFNNARKAIQVKGGKFSKLDRKKKEPVLPKWMNGMFGYIAKRKAAAEGGANAGADEDEVI
jgi:hypothetical protein